jgi:hypothetical protein
MTPAARQALKAGGDRAAFDIAAALACGDDVAEATVDRVVEVGKHRGKIVHDDDDGGGVDGNDETQQDPQTESKIDPGPFNRQESPPTKQSGALHHYNTAPCSAAVSIWR